MDLPALQRHTLSMNIISQVLHFAAKQGVHSFLWKNDCPCPFHCLINDNGKAYYFWSFWWWLWRTLVPKETVLHKPPLLRDFCASNHPFAGATGTREPEVSSLHLLPWLTTLVTAGEHGPWKEGSSGKEGGLGVLSCCRHIGISCWKQSLSSGPGRLCPAVPGHCHLSSYRDSREQLPICWPQQLFQNVLIFFWGSFSLAHLIGLDSVRLAGRDGRWQI